MGIDVNWRFLHGVRNWVQFPRKVLIPRLFMPVCKLLTESQQLGPSLHRDVLGLFHVSFCTHMAQGVMRQGNNERGCGRELS